MALPRPPRSRSPRPRGRRWRLRRAGTVLAATLAVTGVLAARPTTPTAPEGTVVGAGTATAVRGSYLVTLRPTAPRAATAQGRELVTRYGGTVKRTYTHVLHGYAVSLSPQQAARLAADPAVDTVYQDRTVRVAAEQPTPPSWGLDRVDQRALPLDQRYRYPDDAGTGVPIYVIDTGVRISHQDLAGRARHGYDAVDGDTVADDGNGHGTHVATVAAGTRHGVAKQAEVVAVRVLDDQGYGTTEQVVAGVDWVTRTARGPAVANLSLGGDPDPALDEAVRNAIEHGVTFTVAAGNTGVEADQSSPARVAQAITVGATEPDDSRAPYSNFGAALDLFAPGTDITGGWHTSDQAARTLSGTSMAAPHAAGAAAAHLATHPDATPARVEAALVADASTGVVRLRGRDSPDRLLYVPSP